MKSNENHNKLQSDLKIIQNAKINFFPFTYLANIYM